MSPRVAAGLGVIGFVAVVNAAFTALVILFGYDDVLREPAAEVLRRFRAGGAPLVAAWAVFTAGALAFAWVGPMAERAAGARLPGWLAPAAGLAMAAGLLRWVVAVPALAAAHQAPGAGEATRAAAEMAYLALHHFAGAGIGELLGQVLLMAWTLAFARALRPAHPWLALAGLATLPLWLAGLSEPLATGWPGLPVIEAAPIAFMAWEAWLVALGVVWIARSWRLTAPRYG
jgi:hypothetical protein